MTVLNPEPAAADRIPLGDGRKDRGYEARSADGEGTGKTFAGFVTRHDSPHSEQPKYSVAGSRVMHTTRVSALHFGHTGASRSGRRRSQSAITCPHSTGACAANQSRVRTVYSAKFRASAPLCARRRAIAPLMASGRQGLVRNRSAPADRFAVRD